MAKQPKKMITGKVVSPKVFETLVSRVGSMNSKMATTRGELGSFVKDAEETHGIHRGAFKLAVKLHGMDDLKMKDFLRGFDLYREYLKLDTRGNSDLLEDGDGDDAEGGTGETSDDEWDASAPEQDEGEAKEGDGEYSDEAVRPGVVKVQGQTVSLGDFKRQLDENNAKGQPAKPNPLDDLTAGTTR